MSRMTREMEDRWDALCEKEGWDHAIKVTVLEGFILENGYFADLVEYAENKHAGKGDRA